MASRNFSASSPSAAERTSAWALVMASLTSCGKLAPCSLKFLSALYTNVSASFRISIISFLFLSSSACASASRTICSMSESDKPPEDWMVTFCSLPVALSLALTLTMPFASMSNVTSICGTPRGAGGIPTRSN